MKLILIGYRGTGKTTVARLLSARWKCGWCDVDAEIQRRAGQSISAIFAEQGEAVFRRWEENLIAELADQPHGVLALGGGAVLSAANRQAIQGGRVLWLTAEPETILARIAADPASGPQRPPLTSTGGLREIRSLLAQREALYRDCADLIVATDGKSPEEVASEVTTLLGAEGGPPPNTGNRHSK